MSKSLIDPEQRTPAEQARLRDEGLKRMLKTPPRAHKSKKHEKESSQSMGLKGPSGNG